MDETIKQIASADSEIKRVEKEIGKVEERLSEALPKEDMTYWRKEKEQLRKEKEQLREEKLLLLKNQLEQSRPPLPPTEREMETDRKVDLILKYTMTADRATPQYSAAHIASRVLPRLKSDSRFIEFEERPGEASILSAEEQTALSNMENEHQVVAFITPHLSKIFCDFELSVFNSEEYKWIETSSETSKYNDKPDLLICHPAITSKKPPFQSQDTVLNQLRENNSFLYGILSDWKLRDAIGLTCEAKVSIDNKGFGEVINYGAHLCFGDKHASITTRLILFDKTQCWLVEVLKGHVSEVKTFKWRDAGSRTLLQKFVRLTPLTKVLAQACNQFNVTVEQDSFLGAGAFGYVFRAKRSDNKFVALKVVVGSSDSTSMLRLEKERSIMNQAHGLCPDTVMGIEEDGYAVLKDGGALLMSKVGEHYSNLTPKDIVDSLKTLHDNGILHGDARLDNVVSVDRKPVWVDFAESYVLPAEPMVNASRRELKQLKDCVGKKFNGYNA